MLLPFRRAIHHTLLGLSLVLVGCAASTGPSDAQRGCSLSNGTTCPVGSECPAGDGCNSCTCTPQLLLVCTRIGCVPPDAGMWCAASAQCPTGQRCIYSAGCGPNNMGRCTLTNGCDMLPVVQQSCGCDGMTFTHGGCAPERPFASGGMCTAPDGGVQSTRFPGAMMLWQAPAGESGAGPAVIVTADGVVRTYANTSSLVGRTPQTLPPADAMQTLSIATIDDLFMRWFNTSTLSLPHTMPGAQDCYPVVFTQLCGNCTPRLISYRRPPEMLPEMESIWSWFDTNVPSTRPRTFCQ